MKTVWKFDIGNSAMPFFSMPVGAQILCVQLQDGQLCIWALVDTEAGRETRGFFVVGTGHQMPEYSPGTSIHYIGTCQLTNGLVFHVFEATLDVDIEVVANKEFKNVGDDGLFPNHSDKDIWISGFVSGAKWASQK